MTRLLLIAIVVFSTVLGAFNQSTNITDAEYAFVSSLYPDGAHAVVEDSTATISEDFALPQDKLLKKLKGLKTETAADFLSKNHGAFRFDTRLEAGGRIKLIDRQTILDVIFKPQYRYDGWKAFNRRYGNRMAFDRSHVWALMVQEPKRLFIEPISQKRAVMADSSYMSGALVAGGLSGLLSSGSTTSELLSAKNGPTINVKYLARDVARPIGKQEADRQCDVIGGSYTV